MKQKKMSFRDRVANDVQKQKTKGSSYGYLKLTNGIPIFKESAIQNNRITLDIIPYIVTVDNHSDEIEKGDPWYKRPFKIHRNIGANKETVVCLSSFGKRCPICEERARRMKAGADKEETDLLKPSARNLYNVIPIGAKGFDEKVHLWDSSHYLFQKLLNDELEENPDYGIFPDLEEGLSLRIRFEEQTIGKNKFFEATRIDFIERDSTYSEEILKQVADLDNTLTELSYKELELKFLELDESDLAEEEVEEVQVTAPVRKPKPAPQPVEDDEKENEEDDTSVVPVVQRKHSSVNLQRKPATKPVEDDAEDEDDDDTPKSDVQRKIPEWNKQLAREKEKTTLTAKTTSSTPARQATKPAENRCPHGHKFGIDVDKFKECNHCKIWDDCIEESEK